MADKNDEALLKEIRERYQYASAAWREAREESQTDRRYLAGDPWTEEDKLARKDRPTINHDELNQYVNQSVNFVRQNKRGIKVEPDGKGSSDKTAEFRENLTRGIEYKSKAQQAYTTAFEQMIHGSYGFFRVSRRYVSNDPTRRDPSLFDQEIVIKTIPNQDSVLYDPDCKEPDWADANYCFVLDPMPVDEFQRRWPDAEKTNFSAEDMRVASDWIKDKIVLVAEYWKVVVTPHKRYLLASGEVVDTLPKGAKPKHARTVEEKTLVQYMTNGVEILESIEQPGTEIPIPAMIGKQMYVDEGGMAKRLLFSLPRLARDPQLSLAYLCSQQMEEAGLTPKTPYVGYKGQFESDSEAWESATKVPHAFLQADPLVDGATNAVLPLPRREPFTPNFQQYEIAKDSCRRAIQAAMGISPLPTAAQRNNEKSGIALEKIQSEQAIGSFHFLDNYDRAIERAGRIVDSWIPVVYDTERTVALHKPDDSRELVTINTAEPYVDPKTNEERHYPVEEADHDITISTSPSNESQRDAASDFLDTLIGNLGKLPVAPPQAAKLLALAIQMKQLGPKGDEMSEIISPDAQAPIPPQAQQAIQQAQGHAQALYAYVQQLQGELQKLQMEKQAKVVDNEYKLQIEKMREENALTIAEVNTKAQQISERLQTFNDMMKQFHAQAHDVGLQASDQAHEQSLAAQQAQQQQALAQQQQQTDQQQPEAA